jgi:hypothetical protein
MSTARCGPGRYCRLAMSASRRPSRAVMMAAGSAESGLTMASLTRASGIGCSQLTSGPAGSGAVSGSGSAPLRPLGSTRRLRCSNALRQALVAMR